MRLGVISWAQTEGLDTDNCLSVRKIKTRFFYITNYAVCGKLDHCFIMTHSQQRWFTNLLSCDILETRHHAQAYVTSGALIDCALSLAARTQTAAAFDFFAGQCLLWLLSSPQLLLRPHLFFQPIWGWGDLGLSRFLNQIPHQKEPEISVGIFSHTWK